MKSFIKEDFLLDNEPAKKLFQDYAKDMPIFDYHNHLPPQEIYERKSYDNLTQVWLYADHYKWRAMRNLGIDEKYITGDAPDYEKFEKWAYTVARIPGSPLYHWTHLELQRYFGITKPLNPSTCKEIYDECEGILEQPGFDAVGLLNKMGVKALCTTDEPFDSLEYHSKISEDGAIPFKVLPTFRPDAVVHVDTDIFVDSVKKLANSNNMEINSLEDLKNSLKMSIERFKDVGCILADIGFVQFRYSNEQGASDIFAKAMKCEPLTDNEITCFTGEMLRFLAEQFKKNNMAMQLHMNALRNVNAELFREKGANVGCDSVGNCVDANQLGGFFNYLSANDILPKTVLYSLNPNDNTVLSSMAGNFSPYIQFGAAWWFQDHVRGISNQLDEQFEAGLISKFIGMLTDSRSFTSYGRHEYFRRILCNRLGELVDYGEYPEDYQVLGEMVKDICFNNAVEFFGLEL